MRRIRMIGALLAAAFALSAVAATGAWAAGEGPHWLVLAKKLEAGNMVNYTAKSTSVTKMKSAVATVLCGSAATSGALAGGSPGTLTAKLKYTECTVEGSPQCKVRSVGAASWGTIATEANGELIYVGTEKQAEKEEGPIGDIYTPKEGMTFVEAEFEGTCPTGVTSPTKVTGSMIAEIIHPGEDFVVGKLVVPEKAIKSGFKWEGKGKVKKVSATLKVFGTVVMTLSGEAEIELESKEEWGAAVS